MILSTKDIERFWDHVDKSDNSSCWPWVKGVFSHFPHGKFKANGKTLKTHRVSYFLEFKHLPPLLRHTCDNARCCNPFHIIPGSQKDNMNDMVERRRSTFGEKNPNAKLSEQDILEIRSSKDVSNKQLAKLFNVSSTQIQYIRSRRNWKHI